VDTDQQLEGSEEGKKGPKIYLKEPMENLLVCLKTSRGQEAEEPRVGCGAQGQMIPRVSE
jgi:hypothetical protein